MKSTSSSSRSRIPAPAQTLVRRVLNRLAIGNNVSVGTDFRAGIGTRINSLHGLTVGHSVSIGPGSLVEVDGQLGDFVLIARNVQIVGRNDHSIDEIGVPIVRGLWVGDRPQSEADTVLIERDVWVGAAAIILGGVTIGEGSVVGAGSVVTRDVPPYTIVAGVPASAVGKRFESEDERRRHSEALDALSIKSPKKQSSESEPRV